MALPDDVLSALQAYSQGRVTWRKTATRLMLDQYSELEAMMREAQLPLPMPNSDKEAQTVAELRQLFMENLQKAEGDGEEV